MFQPPFSQTSQNRFSSLGMNHLYFADSLLGAQKATHCLVEKHTWIEGRLKNTLQILDATDLSNPIFKFCHYQSDSINDKLKTNYLFPNFISDCAKHCGFDGIKYRSILDNSVLNYVFFDTYNNSFTQMRIGNIGLE
jgi:hypothetical protein